MNQPTNTWIAPDAAGNGAQHSAYHPECGAEHHHKPSIDMVGVGLLVVLSFLLYEFNGKAPQPHTSSVAVHQNMAFNR
jgi:hypothetical protein